LEAKTSRMVLETGLDAKWNLKDGSVVCGDLWYGAAYNQDGQAIAVVDISKSQGKLIGIKALDIRPLRMKCGKQFDELIIVGADNGRAGSPTTFHLVRVGNLTSAVAPTSRIIGAFPKLKPWLASSFQFTEDSLYAHFPQHNHSQQLYDDGEVFKMDLTTGNIVTHKQYEGSPGMPVFVAPSDGKSSGVFAKPRDDGYFGYIYYFCQVDASGSEVKVFQCRKDTDQKWFNVQISASCDGDNKYFFHSLGSETQEYTPIYGIDMSSGDLSDIFHINFDYDWHSPKKPQWYAGAMTRRVSKRILV